MYPLPAHLPPIVLHTQQSKMYIHRAWRPHVTQTGSSQLALFTHFTWFDETIISTTNLLCAMTTRLSITLHDYSSNSWRGGPTDSIYWINNNDSQICCWENIEYVCVTLWAPRRRGEAARYKLEFLISFRLPSSLLGLLEWKVNILLHCAVPRL